MMYNDLVQLCLWATYLLFDLNQYVFSVQWKKSIQLWTF